MTDPNLMVEMSAEDLADMIAATTFHVEEVNRNPYHLLLPPWMMDNVRRGGEVAGGQGGTRARLHVCRALPVAQMEPGPGDEVLRGRQAGSCLHEHCRPVSMKEKFMREAIRLSIQDAARSGRALRRGVQGSDVEPVTHLTPCHVVPMGEGCHPPPAVSEDSTPSPRVY